MAVHLLPNHIYSQSHPSGNSPIGTGGKEQTIGKLAGPATGVGHQNGVCVHLIADVEMG